MTGRIEVLLRKGLLIFVFPGPFAIGKPRELESRIWDNVGEGKKEFLKRVGKEDIQTDI